MQMGKLAGAMSQLAQHGWQRYQSEAKAEIGSEPGLGSSAPQNASSSHGCDSRSCPNYGSWYKEFPRHEHHSEPCAGDSERRPPSLRDFESSVSNSAFYIVYFDQISHMGIVMNQRLGRNYSRSQSIRLSYLPCLRLFTPSPGSGEEALSLAVDMTGGSSTSFHVQIGHDTALFIQSSHNGTLKACWE